eukprot:12100004-Prorocentrum_lima.AAC.1
MERRRDKEREPACRAVRPSSLLSLAKKERKEVGMGDGIHLDLSGCLPHFFNFTFTASLPLRMSARGEERRR